MRKQCSSISLYRAACLVSHNSEYTINTHSMKGEGTAMLERDVHPLTPARIPWSTSSKFNVKWVIPHNHIFYLD